MSYLRDIPDQKYCIFDFETESLNLLADNKPWSIGYLIYQNGKILKRVHKYIKWKNINVSKGAAQITGFDINKYHSLSEDANIVLDEFEQYLNDPNIISIAHNAVNFDIYVLKIWREELGRENDYAYLDCLIDTNSTAKAIKKGIKQIKPEERKMMMFRFANYIEKGMKTNLTALGKEYNIHVDYEKLHDALRDIELTLKIFEKIKWQIEI